MSVEEEKVKQLIEIRNYIEKKIRDLEAEIEILRTLLSLIDQNLASLSFRPASQLLREESREETTTRRETITETPLAKYNVYSRKLHRQLAEVLVYEDKVVLRPTIKVHVTTPPFESFFKKLLEKIKHASIEKWHAGEISRDEIFDYEIREGEEGEILEIVLYNVREDRVLREIRGAFRWTLETMFLRESQKEDSYESSSFSDDFSGNIV